MLFAGGESAAEFLTHVYPLFANCLVASADRAYPKNPVLREKVFAALEDNPKLKVIVFNLEALKAAKVRTERLLVMDELVMQDFRKHPAERERRLELSAEKIVFLIESFFQQWDRMARIGNVGFSYRHFAEFEGPRFDWRVSLVAPPSPVQK